MSLHELPRSRDEAIKIGSWSYFDGKPCSNGHVSPRITKSYKCIQCRDEHNAAYKARNKKVILEQDRQYAKNHRQKRLENSRRWRIDNRGLYNSQVARRNAAKRQATPHWLSSNDITEIEAIYRTAAFFTKETEIQFHVDHIYPLRSDFLCGLHVPSNLIVLSARQNSQKSNRWWPGQLPDQVGRGRDHEWWRQLNLNTKKGGC